MLPYKNTSMAALPQIGYNMVFDTTDAWYKEPILSQSLGTLLKRGFTVSNVVCSSSSQMDNASPV